MSEGVIRGLLKAIREEAEDLIIGGFRHVVKTGGKLKPEREPGPFASAPDVQEGDLDLIVNQMLLDKWANVHYYGPGAKDAEKRRMRRLGLPVPDEPKPEEHPHGAAKPDAEKRKSLRERLRELRREAQEIERLKTEIEGLKAQNDKARGGTE